MGKIAIVGVEASGKTVLVAALAGKFGTMSDDSFYLLPENKEAFAFMTQVPYKMMVEHSWPSPTGPDSTFCMKWSVRIGSEKVLANLDIFDYGGEVYRMAFGNYSEEIIAGAREQIDEFLGQLLEAETLVVLLNVKDLLNPETNARNLDTCWLTRSIFDYSQKLPNLKDRLLVFTQADRYREELASAGGPKGLLREKLSMITALYPELDCLAISAVQSEGEGKGIPGEIQETDLQRFMFRLIAGSEEGKRSWMKVLAVEKAAAALAMAGDHDLAQLAASLEAHATALADFGPDELRIITVMLPSWLALQRANQKRGQERLQTANEAAQRRHWESEADATRRKAANNLAGKERWLKPEERAQFRQRLDQADRLRENEEFQAATQAYGSVSTDVLRMAGDRHVRRVFFIFLSMGVLLVAGLLFFHFIQERGRVQRQLAAEALAEQQARDAEARIQKEAREAEEKARRQAIEAREQALAAVQLVDVVPVRSDVEMRMTEIRTIKRGQGLGQLIDAAEKRLEQAAAHYDHEEYGLAMEIYRQMLGDIAAIASTDQERRKATALRDRVTEHQNELVRRYALLPQVASSAFSDVERMAKQASNAYEFGSFDLATQKWNGCLSVYDVAKATLASRDKAAEREAELLRAHPETESHPVASAALRGARALARAAAADFLVGKFEAAREKWQAALKEYEKAETSFSHDQPDTGATIHSVLEQIQVLDDGQGFGDRLNGIQTQVAQAANAYGVGDFQRAQSTYAEVYKDCQALLEDNRARMRAQSVKRKAEERLASFADEHKDTNSTGNNPMSPIVQELARTNDRARQNFEAGKFAEAQALWETIPEIMTEAEIPLKVRSRVIEKNKDLHEQYAATIQSEPKIAQGINGVLMRMKDIDQQYASHQFSAAQNGWRAMDDDLGKAEAALTEQVLANASKNELFTIWPRADKDSTMTNLLQQAQRSWRSAAGDFSALRFVHAQQEWADARRKFDQAKAQVFSNRRYTVGQVAFEMILIHPGTFQMGSPAGENGRNQDEVLHPVSVSQPYWLGKTEVTQALYEEIMGHNPSHYKDARHPVDNVTWDGARQFCQKLTARFDGWLPAGYVFDLPTEAQWEYAARGGPKNDGTVYAGSADINRVAWNANNSAWSYVRHDAASSHPVGTKVANGLGLFDLSGNVWEWCRDWYGAYDLWHVAPDPRGPVTGQQRICRGGGWDSSPVGCRIAHRFHLPPAEHYDDLGFRVALVAKTEK